MCKPNYKTVRRWIPTLCVIIASTVFCFNFKIIFINGDSMQPTLTDGTPILTTRHTDIIENNDIAIFENDNTLCIKRIIGMNNDHINLRNNAVYVNDVKISNSYYNGEDKEYILSYDEIFVTGDNVMNSLDSRNYGPIKLSQIKYIKI